MSILCYLEQNQGYFRIFHMFFLQLLCFPMILQFSLTLPFSLSYFSKPNHLISFQNSGEVSQIAYQPYFETPTRINQQKIHPYIEDSSFLY